jgi:integration host factor subunit alpha
MHDPRSGAPVNEIDSSALRYALGKACPSRDRLSRAVTKADIARAICARTPSLSLRSATSLIDAIVEEIILALASDQILRLHCFGSFSVRVKGERPGRNPRTGVAAIVNARRVVIFRASAKLIAAVASSFRA